MLVSGCAWPLVPIRIEIEPISKIWPASQPSTTNATHLVIVAGRVFFGTLHSKNTKCMQTQAFKNLICCSCALLLCTRPWCMVNLELHFAGEPQIDEARQTKLLTAPRYNSPKSAPIPHIILTRASTKRKHHNTPGRGGKDDTRAKKDASFITWEVSVLRLKIRWSCGSLASFWALRLINGAHDVISDLSPCLLYCSLVTLLSVIVLCPVVDCSPVEEVDSSHSNQDVTSGDERSSQSMSCSEPSSLHERSRSTNSLPDDFSRTEARLQQHINYASDDRAVVLTSLMWCNNSMYI